MTYRSYNTSIYRPLVPEPVWARIVFFVQTTGISIEQKVADYLGVTVDDVWKMGKGLQKAFGKIVEEFHVEQLEKKKMPEDCEVMAEVAAAVREITLTGDLGATQAVTVLLTKMNEDADTIIDLNLRIMEMEKMEKKKDIEI